MTTPDVLQLVNALPEPILLLSADGTILGANVAGQEFLSADIADLSRKNLSDIVENPPEKLKVFLSQCARSRQPIPGGFTVRRLEGSVSCRFTGAVLNFDERNRPVLWLRLAVREPANSRFLALNQRIVELNREIVRRQRAENFLAGQKQVLELLAQDTPLQTVLEALLQTLEPLLGRDVRGSVLLIDETGKHLVHGAAPRLPTFYIDEIDGMRIGPSAGSCGTAAFLGDAVVVQDIETDDRWINFRGIARRANLRACWSTPILGKTGKVLGTFAMYYDQTKTPTAEDLSLIEVATRTAAIAIEKARAGREKERAEEALRRTEKLAAAGRLAATIAHEINNPLEAVTNLLYLASHDPQVGDDARTFLKMAEDELSRVAHISKQTLGFYRETGAPEKVAVSELLDGVVSIYAGKLKDRGIHVVRNYRPTPQVFIAKGELRQLFSNLVANAIDAMEADGVLTLEICGCTITDEQRVCIKVMDNGVGMRPEVRERLFEPFFTTKVGVGTGLGLWVSHGIVQKYKGCLRVESSTELPGRGTSFYIELPATAHSEPLGAAG